VVTTLAGAPVDAERAVGVVVAQGAPQPGRSHQQVHPRAPGEFLIPGGADVPCGGDGDVGVDVKAAVPAGQ
jgi:hypothetical protein